MSLTRSVVLSSVVALILSTSVQAQREHERFAKGAEAIVSAKMVLSDTTLALSGRSLQTAKNRESYVIIQLSEGANVVDEVLTIGEAQNFLMPIAETVRGGVAMNLRSTTVGMGAVAGVLNGRFDPDADPDDLTLSMARLTDPNELSDGAFEAVMTLDFGDRVVWLVFDGEGLVGARFVASDIDTNGKLLYRQSLHLLKAQRIARIKMRSPFGGTIASGVPVSEGYECCPTNCSTCCCNSSSGCSSDADSSDCGGGGCKCTGGTTCVCSKNLE